MSAQNISPAQLTYEAQTMLAAVRAAGFDPYAVMRAALAESLADGESTIDEILTTAEEVGGEDFICMCSDAAKYLEQPSVWPFQEYYAPNYLVQRAALGLPLVCAATPSVDEDFWDACCCAADAVIDQWNLASYDDVVALSGIAGEPYANWNPGC